MDAWVGTGERAGAELLIDHFAQVRTINCSDLPHSSRIQARTTQQRAAAVARLDSHLCHVQLEFHRCRMSCAAVLGADATAPTVGCVVAAFRATK